MATAVPRILLVEDNESNRYLAKFLLERQGLCVQEAINGREALHQARAWQPDLIILDIQMPEMDGYEAGQQLRAAVETRHIPLVAASSFAMAGDRERALQLGFADYFEKPYDPETFVERILRQLPPREGGEHR